MESIGNESDTWVEASRLVPDRDTITASIAQRGFVFVAGSSVRALLEGAGELNDWDDFRQSWNRLETDQYMADRGRYRLRRHAVFTVDDVTLTRQAHRPHFQALDYNVLNGGVERWFAPIEPAAASARCLTSVLNFCNAVFSPLSPLTKTWNVEVHQFRILASSGEHGQPTPEGMHRDGVHFVLVLMIRRENVASGTTLIETRGDGKTVALSRDSFTLTGPFDAAFVNDAVAYHGVTPVEPVNATLPAYRDVLVVTFRDPQRPV